MHASLKESIGLLLPFLSPLFILWAVLLVLALRDLIRRPASEVVGGNKLLWGIVVVVFEILGPLAYFAFGRRKA